MFGAVGNHELLDPAGVGYVRYFAPASSGDTLYWTFRWSNARFFLLNGSDTWSSGPEALWLRNELERADSEAGLVWRIVVIHFGPWAAGPHGNNPQLAAGNIPALFKQHKVDLILSGHDHIYERGDTDGMRYVVSGGGGAPLYKIAGPLPSTRKAESTYHYVEFKVTPAEVALVAKRIDGSILDRCSFTKAPGWSCDPATPAARPVPAPAPAPAPESSSPVSSASRCGCRVVGSGGAAGVGLVLLLGLMYAGRRWRKCSSS
jgi:hypothetical protein